MIFREAGISGAYVIELERIEDERGYFARTWCWDEFLEHGLDTGFVQCNTSFSRRRGTLRGLHFQTPPHDEAKLIRCTRGRVFDVALDVRADSPTRGKWMSAELSADSEEFIYLGASPSNGTSKFDGTPNDHPATPMAQ